MNWEEYFNDFKRGDKVKLVKVSEKCQFAGHPCCKCYLNKVGIITGIDHEKKRYNFECSVGNCWFEKECLERVR